MKDVLSHPVDRDNEAIIISNAIKNKENREAFVRKVTYEQFRLKEFQTLAWGIIEADKAKMEINVDAILLKSKFCPVRYLVDFEFVQQIVTNFSEVTLQNFLEHIEKLAVDNVKQRLIEWTMGSLYPACTDPTKTLANLSQRLAYGQQILEGAFSASKLGFKSMEEVAAEYDLAKATGVDKRTTGFSQLDALLTEGFKDGQITTIAGVASMGKCLKKGTEIIMYDCSFKKVENVKVGDLLMGPDSKPRKVLETTKGFGKIYKVKQKRGEDYFVNENHILSLQKAGSSIRTKVGAKKGSTISIGWKENGEILNISILDALKNSNNFFKKHRGYRANLDFEKKDITLDPYFLGLWIGDGSSTSTTIHNPDIEIKNYLKEYAKSLGMLYHEDTLSDKKHCSNCRITSGHGQKNYILDCLKQYNLLNNKHIPNEYKFNSKEVRLQFLAGLLDSDGFMTSGIHEISTKYDSLKEDILFLGRSLGFYCVAKLEKKEIKSINFSGMYWRIRICGYNEIIPNKVERKKAYKHKKKFRPELTTISIDYDSNDEYYGFELDGDCLFLLKDLTVTHNSSFTLSVMRNLSQASVPTAQFALEMNNMSLFTKLLSFRTRLPMNRVIKKPEDLEPNERTLYEYEKSLLSQNKYIFLNDTPSQSVSSIREQIMLLQDSIKQQYFVCVIDLFGKIRDLQSSDNFARDYEKKLNEIQVMVRELGVHMILVAQINKEVSKRKNKRPTMADLKNSGALTEVSDIVIGIHRPYYDPELALKTQLAYGMVDGDDDNTEEDENEIEEDINKNIAEILIMKQRMGPKDVLVNFTFDPITTGFYPITESYQRQLNKIKMDEEM